MVLTAMFACVAFVLKRSGLLNRIMSCESVYNTLFLLKKLRKYFVVVFAKKR